MSITDEARDKLDKLDADRERKAKKDDLKAGAELKNRIAESEGKAPADDPSEDEDQADQVFQTTEEAIESLEDDELLEKLSVRIKSDSLFARAVRSSLQDAKVEPLPKWLEVHDLFTATIHFGSGNDVKIRTTSYGSRNSMLLSTKMLKIRQLIAQMDADTKDIEEEDIPLEMISERNNVIGKLGVLQTVETIGANIIRWDGELFSMNGQSMPLLTSFNLDKDEDASEAMALINRLPNKVIETVSEGVKLLNNIGLEDDWARGN